MTLKCSIPWTVLLPLVLLLGMVPAGPTDAGEPIRIRVLSYNIHHGEGTDGVLDLERIARVIRSVDPDVVALNEVDRGTGRTDRVDQPAELARLTGLRALFERNIRYQGGDYGNAILTRLPVRAWRNHPLPSMYEGERRGALRADLYLGSPEDPETPILRFYATHLDYRRDDAERLASARMFADLVAESPGLPTLLVGDLNADPTTRVLERFRADWRRVGEEPGVDALATYPAGEARGAIDHILYRPADRWRVVEVRALDEPIASDHLPLFAVLEWNDEE